MIGRFISWIMGTPVLGSGLDAEAEENLVKKQESLDRSIERGRACADKLRRSSDKQVAEANVAIATIRGLLTLLQEKQDKS